MNRPKKKKKKLLSINVLLNFPVFFFLLLA